LYAIPSGISAAQFTRWHLDHHAELGSTEDDPKRAHLTPKINRRWYKLQYFTPALFFIYFRAARREALIYSPELRAQIARERRVATLFHLCLGGAIAYFAGWGAMLRAWAVPVFVVFPIAFAINRLGQHYDVNPDDVAQWSTLMKPSWFWDLAYLNSNYHLEHHYFPRVPSYNLPKLARLLQPFYKAHAMRTHSYAELLWKYLVLNRPPHTNWDEAAMASGTSKLSRGAAV
jgi:fatty acid desaturase